MACPACLVAFAGTDGLPSGMGAYAAPLGQTPAQPAPPTGGIEPLLNFGAGIICGYIALKWFLPSMGDSR